MRQTMASVNDNVDPVAPAALALASVLIGATTTPADIDHAASRCRSFTRHQITSESWARRRRLGPPSQPPPVQRFTALEYRSRRRFASTPTISGG
jgi:hypothetical protein